MSNIKYPLTVIDGRVIKLTEAFSWLLHYVDPNKKNPNIKTIVFDMTCSEMIMWKLSDFEYFKVITNDIRKGVKADYHKCCSQLYKLPLKVHIVIYDPPYYNKKNRKDDKHRIQVYGYNMMETLEQLESLTQDTAMSSYGLLKENGILIAKITDFHYGKDEELRGSFDFREWFSDYFVLQDDYIYRFYKPIPNLGQYSKKSAITHSHFMIFKPRK